MTARDSWGQVAHNLRILADSIDAAIEPPAGSAGVPASPAVSAAAAVPPPAAAAPSVALGLCPKHRVAWTVKAGGVSKAGKSYAAFWKCNEKDPSEERGYCQQKPDFGWVRTHPPEQAMVAVDDDVPF